MATVKDNGFQSVEEAYAAEYDPNFHGIIEAANNASSKIDGGVGNRFSQICDLVLSRITEADTTLEELLHWNDVIKGALPANAVARMADVKSRVSITQSTLATAVFELTRLVRVYAPRWRAKESVISQLLDGYRTVRHEKDMLIRSNTINSALVRRLRQRELVSKWERLYIMTSLRCRHGSRWKYLIDAFRSKLEQDSLKQLMRETASGDESDEEDSELAEPLPRKKKKNAKLGQKEGKIISSHPSASGGDYTDPSAESDEVTSLKLEVEHLHMLLNRNPMVSQSTQTEATDEGNNTTAVKNSESSEWASNFITPEVLRIDLNEISGWSGIIPGDVYCSFECKPKSVGGLSSDTLESAMSTAPAKPDRACEVVGFDCESLTFTMASKSQTMEVLVRSGFNGEVMATGQCPTDYLLDVKAQPSHESSLFLDGIETTNSKVVTFSVPLETTPAYSKYCQEATGTISQPYDSQLVLQFTCQALSLAEHNQQVAKPEQSSRDGVASRRHLRLEEAGREDVDTTRENDEAPLDLSKFLFDPQELDLEKATFSMQEVSILAMLHAKQMQAAQEVFKKQMLEAQAQFQKLLDEEREKIPDPPETSTCDVQTDPMPAPEPVIVVEEKVVEKEVEKIVKVVETKVVEKRVEVEVEKIVEKIVKIREYEDRTSSIEKLRNYPVRDPNYLGDMPDDFFDRLNFFMARKVQNHAVLSEKTRTMVQDALLSEMDASNTLDRSIDPFTLRDGDDLILPAKYMPSPNVKYAAHAHGRFHGSKTESTRYSQPPSSVTIHPLPYRLEQGEARGHSRGARTLNLYEQSEDMESNAFD